MILYEEECYAAGKDPKAVKKLAQTLDRAAKLAEKLHVCIFGGSGTCTIRAYDDYPEDRALILALMNGHMWDGGDGGAVPDENGLLRGE